MSTLCHRVSAYSAFTCHLSLSPSLFDLSVLLEANTYRVKIADFGLAKNDRQTVTRGVGTPAYMPPEMFDDSTEPSKTNMLAVDVYAIGLMLWTQWYKLEPFKGRGIHKVIAMVLKGSRPPLTDVAKLLQEGKSDPVLLPPQPLVELIEACWHQDPFARPPLSSIFSDFGTKVAESVRDSKGDIGVGALTAAVGGAAFLAAAAAATTSGLKVVGWDVGGQLTKAHLKDLEAIVKAEKPDVLCLQGTGLSGAGDKEGIDWRKALPGYDAFWSGGKGGGGQQSSKSKHQGDIEEASFSGGKPAGGEGAEAVVAGVCAFVKTSTCGSSNNDKDEEEEEEVMVTGKGFMSGAKKGAKKPERNTKSKNAKAVLKWVRFGFGGRAKDGVGVSQPLAFSGQAPEGEGGDRVLTLVFDKFAIAAVAAPLGGGNGGGGGGGGGSGSGSGKEEGSFGDSSSNNFELVHKLNLWFPALEEHVAGLEKEFKVPVVVCGGLAVAPVPKLDAHPCFLTSHEGGGNGVGHKKGATTEDAVAALVSYLAAEAVDPGGGLSAVECAAHLSWLKRRHMVDAFRHFTGDNVEGAFSWWPALEVPPSADDEGTAVGGAAGSPTTKVKKEMAKKKKKKLKKGEEEEVLRKAARKQNRGLRVDGFVCSRDLIYGASKKEKGSSLKGGKKGRKGAKGKQGEGEGEEKEDNDDVGLKVVGSSVLRNLTEISTHSPVSLLLSDKGLLTAATATATATAGSSDDKEVEKLEQKPQEQEPAAPAAITQEGVGNGDGGGGGDSGVGVGDTATTTTVVVDGNSAAGKTMKRFLRKAGLESFAAELMEQGYSDVETLSDRELLDDATLAYKIGMGKSEVKALRELIESAAAMKKKMTRRASQAKAHTALYGGGASGASGSGGKSDPMEGGAAHKAPDNKNLPQTILQPASDAKAVKGTFI
jgi:exonuclease III